MWVYWRDQKKRSLNGGVPLMDVSEKRGSIALHWVWCQRLAFIKVLLIRCQTSLCTDTSLLRTRHLIQNNPHIHIHSKDTKSQPQIETLS